MAGTRKHKGLDTGSKQWQTGSKIRGRKGYKVKAQDRKSTDLTASAVSTQTKPFLNENIC